MSALSLSFEINSYHRKLPNWVWLSWCESMVQSFELLEQVSAKGFAFSAHLMTVWACSQPPGMGLEAPYQVCSSMLTQLATLWTRWGWCKKPHAFVPFILGMPVLEQLLLHGSFVCLVSMGWLVLHKTHPYSVQFLSFLVPLPPLKAGYNLDVLCMFMLFLIASCFVLTGSGWFGNMCLVAFLEGKLLSLVIRSTLPVWLSALCTGILHITTSTWRDFSGPGTELLSMTV